MVGSAPLVVAATVTVAVVLSIMLMLAGVLLTLTSGFAELVKVTTAVSIPSTRLSANTGMLMVAVVCPAGMVMVLVTIVA
ncbi:hypothetical protein D3C87_716080 [compost metagenome]